MIKFLVIMGLISFVISAASKTELVARWQETQQGRIACHVAVMNDIEAAIAAHCPIHPSSEGK
jgi:hypothetical protein